MKKTKVVCTMGPNTNNRELLRKLIQNGMDVARFNFSHGDHAEHKVQNGSGKTAPGRRACNYRYPARHKGTGDPDRHARKTEKKSCSIQAIHLHLQ